jgi:hypothetical protein
MPPEPVTPPISPLVVADDTKIRRTQSLFAHALLGQK